MGFARAGTVTCLTPRTLEVAACTFIQHLLLRIQDGLPLALLTRRANHHRSWFDTMAFSCKVGIAEPHTSRRPPEADAGN